MRSIGVVTTSRADYGIYVPLLAEIQRHSGLALHLIVSGTHLAAEFGATVQEIERDGLPIGERVEMLVPSDEPAAIAKSMGLGVIGFAEAYQRHTPDLLVVLGDRFEMHAAALAALPFRIPVAHIAGGEITAGAIDESLRHSMTKLSHLHFATTQEYGRRLLRLGEEPWRVTVSGALNLDNLQRIKQLSKSEVEQRLGCPLVGPALLVTFHSVTLQHEQTHDHMSNLLAALDDWPGTVIVTYPNADTGGRTIIAQLREFIDGRPRWHLFQNLGTELYFNVMRHVAAMVGNSSSGIIEAASFNLPVVNIGDRQQGRIRARNTIDVPPERAAIKAAVARAASAEFKTGLADLVNPYGDGHAAEKIVRVLAEVPLDARLIVKHFYDGEP